MTEVYQQYQIGAIFGILFISILGVVTPNIALYVNMDKKQDQNSQLSIERIVNGDSFRIGRGFSTGVILGVAVMHLLVDISEANILNNEYPFNFALVLFAILLMIAFEHISLYVMTTISESTSGESPPAQIELSNNNQKLAVADSHNHGNDVFDNNEQFVTSKREEKSNSNHGHSHNHDLESAALRDHHHLIDQDGAHLHAHSMHMIVDENVRRSLIKAMIMEASIAVHSVIIGFDLGALGSEDISTIRALVIAFIFHQYFEGISLGTAFVLSRLSVLHKVLLGGFYALTLPVGIIIGMYSTDTSSGEIARDVANALAAGSLLYNGLVELAAEEFSDPALAKRPALKSAMFVAMFVGAAFLALLANWA